MDATGATTSPSNTPYTLPVPSSISSSDRLVTNSPFMVEISIDVSGLLPWVNTQLSDPLENS